MILLQIKKPAKKAENRTDCEVKTWEKIGKSGKKEKSAEIRITDNSQNKIETPRDKRTASKKMND